MAAEVAASMVAAASAVAGVPTPAQRLRATLTRLEAAPPAAVLLGHPPIVAAVPVPTPAAEPLVFEADRTTQTDLGPRLHRAPILGAQLSLTASGMASANRQVAQQTPQQRVGAHQPRGTPSAVLPQRAEARWLQTPREGRPPVWFPPGQRPARPFRLRTRSRASPTALRPSTTLLLDDRV